jgi:hypothetical protein
MNVKYETKMKDTINIRVSSPKIELDACLSSIYMHYPDYINACIDFNNNVLNCNIKYMLSESIDEKKLKDIEKEKIKSLRYQFVFNKPGFPEELKATEEKIEVTIGNSNYRAEFIINCTWDCFDKIVDKVLIRKYLLLNELEENGFVEEICPDEDEYFYDFTPEDKSTGSCIFCGDRTYDGDILCPNCANNVD